jgi:hypothetical protein
MQAHLACQGLLEGRYEHGVFDAKSAQALRAFQRRNAIISDGVLDARTRALLALGSREQVFFTALRALRERVVDALGLIEDGSALGHFGQVLGRDLDSPDLQATRSYGALEDGAEDLVSPATEAAAKELGWTSPDALAAFLRALPEDGTRELHVALRLPPAPSYHGPHMQLRAEIDRGDVWYAYPFRADGGLRNLPIERRPTLVLYAKDGERWKPLVRWNTTIGGWQPEQHGPLLGLRYKQSPVGPRLWRALVAAPAWLPPPSTPDKELLVKDSHGRFRPRLDLLGPGFRSAYGLAMLVHLKELPPALRPAHPPAPADEDRFTDDPCCLDEGVRTHGSAAYASILHGYSHGCHRLFNHLALRLMGFLLAHRNHERKGNMRVAYDRVLERAGQSVSVHVRSRGYLYALTPPVPVDVLPGRIRGSVKRPIRGLQPLRQQLLHRVQQQSEGGEPGQPD